MNRFVKTLILVSLVSLWTLSMTSCAKNDNSPTEMEKIIAQNTAASYAFNIQSAKTNSYVGNTDNSQSTTTDCPEVTWAGICHWTFDYSNGCSDAEGNNYSGSFYTTDCVSWTFSQFCVNGYCIDGTINFTENTNCSVTECWDEAVSVTLSGPNDTLTETITSSIGYDGSDWYLFKPSTMTVVSQNYGTYTTTVTEDLILKSSCIYPTTGVISIDIPSHNTIIVDFGTGNCFSVYVNGVEVHLTT